jgi:SAM-dependent methyltransferase
MIRLNLGAGTRRDPGWTHVDMAGDGLDTIHDLTVLPLPYASDTCEAVVLHHVLDLLPFADGIRLLGDIARILRPDGWLRVSSADLLAGVRAGLAGDKDWFVQPRGTLDETLGYFLLQGGARRSYWTDEMLAAALNLQQWQTFPSACGETLGPSWLMELDGRARESWFVEAHRCGG